MTQRELLRLWKRGELPEVMSNEDLDRLRAAQEREREEKDALRRGQRIQRRGY